MGNVGNIEKVMVFGILAIIICILCIAVWGHNAVSDPDNAYATTAGVGDLGNGDRSPSLKRSVVLGDDDPQAGPRILDVDDEMDGVRSPPAVAPVNVTQVPTIAPEEPARSSKRPRTHKIEDGDTYTSLAKRYFGDSNLYLEFEKVNEDIDPRKLRTGMVINVPQLNEADVADASAAGSHEPSAPTPPASSGSTAGGVKYVVQSGDTLSGISRQFYGSPGKWARIAAANPTSIPNPDRLTVGVEIVIP